MDDSIRSKLVAGAKVAVTQQIAMRDRTWTKEVRGTVVEFEQRPTGSWFAHTVNDKLWLDRLVVKKDDGEVSVLNLDDYTRIEMVPTETAAAAAPAPAGEGETVKG